MAKAHWRADGGASLKTYFITGCIYAFLNTYRSWRIQQAHWDKAATFDPADLELFDTPIPDDVAQHALLKIEAHDACSDKSDYQKSVLILRGLGYTHAEIAELLGKNGPAIERLLHRMRNAANRETASERGESP